MGTTIVNPLDETPRDEARIAPRLDTIQGKKIGLLDISKPGGSHFFNRLEGLLKEKYGAREVERFTKPTFTRPAPDEVIDRILKAQCRGVIEALAD